MWLPELNPEDLDPEITYKSAYLWIPKAKINVHAAKTLCSVTTENKRTGMPQTVTFWNEARHHLIVPREAFPEEDLPDPVRVCRAEGKKVNFGCKVSLRKRQKEPYSALSEATGGVLNLACGFGKTVLMLKKIAEVGRATLIIVNQTGLLTQWEDEIAKFLKIKKEDIGRIQGKVFTWKRPIVLATIQTLAKLAQEGKLPSAFRTHFGMSVHDETHHLSAQLFIHTAPLCLGYRFGLTATATRSDGLEGLYQAHLGPVFYSDLSQEVTPRIYFIQLPTEVNMHNQDILDATGEFSIGKFWAHLGRDPFRNGHIIGHVKEAYSKGRRILALTHSKPHAELLYKYTPGSGLITGDTGHSDRTWILRNNKIIYATTHIAAEGLDAPELDTVMFLTPFKEWNIMQQGAGRSLRQHIGKRRPIVNMFWDFRVPPANALCRSIMGGMRRHGWSYKTVLWDNIF